ncbi:MAG: nucleotidyltransferase, partial [Methanobacteriota archaeon]
MKALILAAGEGRRLAPYSAGKPKTLVKIFGTTLLERMLDNLFFSGVREAVIVTGYKNHEIEALVGDNHKGLRISYVHNNVYNKTNNIYSVHLSRKKLGNTGFILINSDVLFHKKILDNLLLNRGKGIILSVDLREKLGEEEMKVRIEHNSIVGISKEIPAAEADGEYIGITRI